MRKYFLLSLGLIIGAVFMFAPQKAYGQGLTWAGESLQQMVEAARWKFGFLRVNAALELLRAGYDSDVYYGYLDDPVPDFTLSAGVPVQVLIPVSKKVVLDLYDYPQYMFYLDTERERAWNNRFRGRTHIALERFYIQAGGGLANVRGRLSPELDINIRERTNSLDGIVLWQASRRMSLAMITSFADFDYGDAEFLGTSIADALNRKEHFFDLVAYVQPNPRIRFFLSGQYGTYAFPEGTEASRDARSYGAFGGFEFIPREGEVVEAARIGGSVSLGYLHLDMIDPEFVDGSGLAGTIDLSFSFSRRTTARAYFSRGFQYSVFSGASFYIATVYGVGVTHHLSRHSTFSYGLSFGRTDYPDDESHGSIPPDFLMRSTTHSASLDIRLLRNLTMSFMGSFGRRSMEQTGVTRARNFIGISLVYGYPPGLVSVPIRGAAR